MRRVGILLLPFLLGACGGGTAPELSDLRTSSRRALVGTEVFMRARVVDVDGDLDGGRLLLRATRVEGGLDLDGEAPVLGFEDGRTEGEVIAGLRLVGAVDPGEYELSLTVEDAAGARSETLTDLVSYQF